VVVIGVAATGITGIAMTSSLLVASGFRGDGVGARILGGVEAIHTELMAMVTPTVTGMATAMAMEVTHTDTALATAMATNTAAMATDTVAGAGPESPSYSAGSLALVITTGPLTASWDREHVEQFARINRTTATPGNAKFLPFASRASGSFDVLLSSGSLVFSGALIAGVVVVHQ
jgi:hypothetical protein